MLDCGRHVAIGAVVKTDTADRGFPRQEMLTLTLVLAIAWETRSLRGLNGSRSVPLGEGALQLTKMVVDTFRFPSCVAAAAPAIERSVKAAARRKVVFMAPPFCPGCWKGPRRTGRRG